MGTQPGPDAAGTRNGAADAPEQPRQLSLLHGFAAPAAPPGKARPAARLPIARVLLDSPLPHLDRPFDYQVPAELDADAAAGARVKVRFGGQELPGFITERRAEPEPGVRLINLGKVVSPQPVLSPEILALAQAVARRYAGTVHDVLRVAIPPRVAKVDKEYAAASATPPGPDTEAPAAADERAAADEPAAAEPAAGAAPDPDDPQPFPAAPGGLDRYPSGPAFLSHLAAGDSPRAVLSSLGGFGPADWPREIAAAVHATVRSGRGALVVVPDRKDLDRVVEALDEVLEPGQAVRLSAEDGPTPRYRNFLRLLHGEARVAVGTRSAAYAPVADLGLVCIWDDGDELHAELRAPYQHAREVLLLRAEAEGAGLLIAGITRTPEAQRLVETGWAASISADRAVVRRLAPRVTATADSFNLERDPLAARARIPHAAWKAAQDGLARGPVLVQVARTGFSPALSCQDCREPARCPDCGGPLAAAGRNAVPACRWCGHPQPRWQCPNCGSGRLRAAAVGAGRTAEELGRAFPSVPVISSAGDHVRTHVSADPALVVATPGAEPVAADGYAAALLLDGTAMLSRESLRAAEDTLRRWFNAAALVRPAAEGGQVVVTAEDTATVGHLLRWDPVGAADRELQQRRELGLPPAVRFASLTGTRDAVSAFLARAELPDAVRMVGPAPVAEEQDGDGGAPEAVSWRTLVFFPYTVAAAVTASLRATRAAFSARRTGQPVYVRVDGLDVL
ncbi:Primosomal protein N' [Arthrobacter saudimassiliensis]|uniref:Probable replication restart protein PriA n=1 Tax=Arthrobacter saudimassiliensis TaxID=1461584 RepID=A0A078MTS9_9MICC|nr:Primosomal protein N' [Arthrobacter saudimassiliensis]